MLKFYLVTVIIWMIIISCTVEMFKEGIKKKRKNAGQQENTEKVSLFKRLSVLFTSAAVPIIRLLIVVIIIYIATCKQEDYDELIKKANE